MHGCSHPYDSDYALAGFSERDNGLVAFDSGRRRLGVLPIADGVQFEGTGAAAAFRHGQPGLATRQPQWLSSDNQATLQVVMNEYTEFSLTRGREIYTNDAKT